MISMCNYHFDVMKKFKQNLLFSLFYWHICKCKYYKMYFIHVFNNDQHNNSIPLTFLNE